MTRAEREAEAFGLLFLLSQHLARGADEALRSMGITGRQWLLLAVLVRAFPDGAPTLSQAAAVYGTSRQNVKQIALQLQERSFVELRSDPDDARMTRVHLADRVRELDEPEARGAQQAFLTDTFAVLADDDLERLRRIVALLVRTGEEGRVDPEGGR